VKVPDLQHAYKHVLRRIWLLAEKSLMSMMVLHNIFSKCITPLQQCICPAWLYIGENETTQLVHGHGMDQDAGVLETALLKSSTNPSSTDFVTPLALYMPFYLN
jgi:hypothetical protein